MEEDFPTFAFEKAGGAEDVAPAGIATSPVRWWLTVFAIGATALLLVGAILYLFIFRGSTSGGTKETLGQEKIFSALRELDAGLERVKRFVGDFASRTNTSMRSMAERVRVLDDEVSESKKMLEETLDAVNGAVATPFPSPARAAGAAVAPAVYDDDDEDEDDE